MDFPCLNNFQESINTKKEHCMQKRTTINSFNTNIFLYSAFFLFFINYLKAQVSAPILAATKICSNSTSLSYTAQFTFTGAQGSGNQFILERSDATGNFMSAVVMGTLTTTTFPATINFTIPSSIVGSDNYKFRMRSTSPASTATNSTFIPMHYLIINDSFSINGGSNSGNTISICSGGSITLAIDPPSVNPNSPLAYSYLKYIWYNGTRNPSNVIPGEIGSFITISTPGTYSVAVDYGACTYGAFGYSPYITVNTAASGGSFAITSSAGSTLCSSGSTILSTTSGYNYKWFKDGVLIVGATANTYSTSVAGSYQVDVNQGGCSSTTPPFVLGIDNFNATVDVLEEPLVNIFTAGNSNTINVSTDAASPTFEWYLSGSLISTAITNSYSTTVPGHYKVKVNQTTGCISSKELLFELKEGVNPTNIPNLISPNGDTINDTWQIPSEYSNANTEIMIVSPIGEIALQTTNYLNNWPEKEITFTNVNPVYYYIITKDGSIAKKGSITVVK